MLPDLANKIYFKIGEVARIVDLKTSVIRFWETEFPFLQPEKSSSGQRLYTKREIDLIFEVKQLLYEEKYTIEGVRKRLLVKKKAGAASLSGGVTDTTQARYRKKLIEIRQDLLNIRAMLY